MFDMGFFELLVVFVIALLVLGPERLPKVARKVGYWSGRARATFNNLRYELEREVHNQDMMEKFRSKAKELGIDEESLSELNKNGLSGSDQKNIGGHGEFDPLAENPTPKPIENNILPPKENTDGNTSDHSSAPPKESSQ